MVTSGFKKFSLGDPLHGLYWGGVCTSDSHFLKWISQKSSIPKILLAGFWKFSPVSEIQPPKVGQFFVKFLTKNVRGPVVKRLRAGMYVFTVFSSSVLCNQQVYQVWAASQAVAGTWPPNIPPKRSILAIFDI